MGLFTRRNKAGLAWDHLADAVGSGPVRQVVKVVAGATAALVGLTAASAAISSIRDQD